MIPCQSDTMKIFKRYQISATGLISMTKNLVLEILIILLLIAFVDNTCRSQEIEDKIVQLSKNGEIDPVYFIAIARQESSLRPKITGDGGNAYGLFQIHLSAAATVNFWGTPEDLFDPSINTVIGISYLYRIYRKLKNNLPCAISGYNRGHHRKEIAADKDCTDHKYYKQVMEKYNCMKSRGIYATCDRRKQSSSIL